MLLAALYIARWSQNQSRDSNFQINANFRLDSSTLDSSIKNWIVSADSWPSQTMIGLYKALVMVVSFEDNTLSYLLKLKDLHIIIR